MWVTTQGLPKVRIEELMIAVIGNMEEPPTSECAPAVGSDNGGKAVRDGFGMDGQWEYHRVRQGTSGGESISQRQTCFLSGNK